MKQKVFSLVCFTLAACLVFGLAGCGSSPASASPAASTAPAGSSAGSAAAATNQVSPTDIAIVSASSGGTAYYIVAGQTTILNENMQGYTFTNESSTGAPSVNCTYCSSDPSMMAYTPFDGLYAATQGDTTRGFTEPLTNLGFIYGGHSLYLYFATLKGSGITTIEDLKGKKISLPPTGTTGYYQSIAVLKEYGIDFEKDVDAVPMNYTDASDAMKDNALDAIIVNGGAKQSTMTELDTTKEIVMLSISDEVQAKLAADYPYWTVDALPAGSYRQQPDGLKVIYATTCLIANLDLSDDVVYNVTKILLGNVDKMAQIHTDGAAWNLDNSVKMIEKNVVTLHPGAEKYYREIGAIK